MLTGLLLLLVVVFNVFPSGNCSSLLCGTVKEVKMGGADGSNGALALALVRPPSQPASEASCQLKLYAPDAAAFAVRLIDVKESFFEREKGGGGGEAARKWSARAAPAQDTLGDAAPPANATDACKLFVYIGDSKNPIWRLSLCGGLAAAVAARAGTRLLPPKLRVLWHPPATPHQHTEKLRLVVTAVNSGSVCSSPAQFPCGHTDLCVSAELACDGVAHCPGGEDEAPAACARRRAPPLLELLRRFAARNQEFLGLDDTDDVTKPSVIMRIAEPEQRPNALMEFAAALRPYGPWSYLVVGMLLCATVLMFCLAWECCCKSSKPSDVPLHGIPASCADLSPIAVTAASLPAAPPAPPAYDPPPSYSSLFPRAYKSTAAAAAAAPAPHCSHQPD